MTNQSSPSSGSTARKKLSYIPEGWGRMAHLLWLSKDLVRLRRRRGSVQDKAGKLKQQISDRLGLLHGLPQKIGQLMAFDQEQGAAFQPLTEDGTGGLPWAVMEKELESEWKAPWTSFFQSIEPTGIAASLGQVHPGITAEGHKVAIKIQYPGIARSLRSDLNTLGWLATPVGNLRKNFDLPAYREEIGEMLSNELDYIQERKHLQFFAEQTQGWSHLQIPELHLSLCSSRVLVMEWMNGVAFPETRKWPEADRKAAGEALLDLFLAGVFSWQRIHADPHPGNFRFGREGNQVVLQVIDFGCVKILSSPFVDGLNRLIFHGAATAPDEEAIWEAFLAMGFQPSLLMPCRGRLPEIARILAEPFHQEGPFDLIRWDAGNRVANALGEHRLSFRTAGPPELIFFLRTFFGLLRYLGHLDVPVAWKSRYENFSKPCVSPTPTPVTFTHPMSLSDYLKIRVNENGTMKVDLTYGAEATESLPILIPLELRPKLEARGINLQEIADRARESQWKPGMLFSITEGTKEVRVWLE